MLIIGLTGGIASGKSVIAKAMAKVPGVIVVDADKLAWEAYQPGTNTYKRIVEHFGEQVLRSDGEIDRVKLGAIVFKDEEELEFLNKAVHPAVQGRLLSLAKEYEAKGMEIMVVEAALLLESPYADRGFFDYIIVAKVDKEEQIRRLRERDGLSYEQALRKISTQAPQEEKLRRADFVIDTTGSPQDTVARAKELLAKLKKLSSSKTKKT